MKRLYSASMRFFDCFGGYFALRNLPYLQKLEYSHTRLRRFQRGMLKALMEHAYNNVPYYHDIFRKLSLNPHYDDPYALLARLPILTKDIVKQQFHRLISPYPLRFLTFQTSGSSGVPLRILKDYPCEGLGQASYYQGLSWYSYDLGDPIVNLWGRRPVLTRRQEIGRVKNRLTNIFELNAHSMNDATIRDYIKKIFKIKPKVLYGYVSSIELVCNYMKEHGLRSYIPIVVTTAETLVGFQRNLISSTLAREVYDQYGCSEITSVAFECPSHTCLHVMPKVILEIVGEQDQKCAAGESGRIVLTDLTNYKMPFLRYEVGDIATSVEDVDSCICGKKLESIKNIEGRISDIIVGPNGNRVHGEFFSALFESSGFAEVHGLKQFQVIQKTTDSLLIRLNISITPTDKTLAYLDNLIKEHLGSVEIHYEFLSDIPCQSTGKQSSAISEVGRSAFART